MKYLDFLILTYAVSSYYLVSQNSTGIQSEETSIIETSTDSVTTTTTQSVIETVPPEEPVTQLGVPGVVTVTEKSWKHYSKETEPVVYGEIAGSMTTPVMDGSDDEGFSSINNIRLKNLKIKTLDKSNINKMRVSGKDFCQAVGLGAVISNGTQQKFETCSLTVHGAIPSFDNMASTIIIQPLNSQNFQVNSFENITVKIKSTGIEYGFFDDPVSLYYFTPQSLNENGVIMGHNHISVQKIQGLQVPDPRTPLFFKGLNERSSDGTLQTVIPASVFSTTGVYRICTSTASQSHAPVLMPVARRGFADDCIRITVV